jgi:hypothetical protein
VCTRLRHAYATHSSTVHDYFRYFHLMINNNVCRVAMKLLLSGHTPQLNSAATVCSVTVVMENRRRNVGINLTEAVSTVVATVDSDTLQY